MANETKLYPYGYIFSDEKNKKIPEYYNEVKVLDKYYYSFDESLLPNILESEDYFIIVHGDFVHVGIDYQYTSQGLLRNLLTNYINERDKFLDELDFIAGRYVIIIGNKEEVSIYPDAANTRTNYFSLEKNIIASHVYLINDQGKNPKLDFLAEIPDLTNGLLNTPFKTIKSTIPNHYLNFYDKSYKRFFPRKKNAYSSLTEEERFELFERFWKKQLDHYFEKYDNFVFSITGGGDSRFSLALLKNYINNVMFFTYSRVKGNDQSSYAGKILTLDYKIVKQMLEDINLNHKFMHFVEDKKELSNRDINILSKNTIGRHSSFLIPHVRANYPQENLKHIRGNLLEVGKTRYFSSEYRSSDLEQMKKVFDNQYKKTKNTDALDYIEHFYQEFIDKLNYGDDIFDYHLLDLYHWEVRMGRWHPEILNTHDIIFDTISPFNHRAMIDISLSFPYEKRRDEYLFKEIINRNFPILNFYGDNNILNLYEQLRNKYYGKA